MGLYLTRKLKKATRIRSWISLPTQHWQHWTKSIFPGKLYTMNSIPLSKNMDAHLLPEKKTLAYLIGCKNRRIDRRRWKNSSTLLEFLTIFITTYAWPYIISSQSLQ